MNFNNIFIDDNTVLKFLGYGKRIAPKIIKDIVDEEILNINDKLDINVYIEEVDINNHNLTGNYIKKCFKTSDKAYAILYTIGSDIETLINYHMNNNDMMRGLALDKVGIVALDSINESIKKHLKDINCDLNISYEVYPGDKDFNLENQKKIYEYIKSSYISINEYNQMNPIKSVAMIICMGKYTNTNSRCENCSKKCY